MQNTTASTLQAMSDELVALAARTASRIVHVHARAGRPMHGLVIGTDLVLTLDHAIERDTVLIKTAEGRTLDAAIAGRDAATNLAVLRAAGLGIEPFTAADDARAGQLVVAVARTSSGAPRASVTVVQSGAARLRGWRTPALGEVVRTDGAYGPDFAGAPLVDPAGCLVAMIPAGALRAAGIGLPGRRAMELGHLLARQGGIPRGYLGIQCQGIEVPEGQRAGTSASRGLLVLSVSIGSAAAQAGLLVGDILIGVDGEPLDRPEHLHAWLARVAVGSVQAIEIIRGGSRQTVNVTIGRRP
jgi:S1-C subfamily serine protease